MGIRETEYDEITGITRHFHYDDDGKVHVYQTKDIEPIKKRAYENRKQTKYTNTGSDEHLNLYAELDYIHLHEALRDKVDINDGKALVKWVNKKHPELRHTNKWHESRRASAGTSRIIVR